MKECQNAEKRRAHKKLKQIANDKGNDVSFIDQPAVATVSELLPEMGQAELHSFEDDLIAQMSTFDQHLQIKIQMNS